MRNILLVVLIACLTVLFAAPVSAEFDGFVKLAYPVDSNTEGTDDKINLNIEVEPTYYVEAEAGYTYNELVRVYGGFDSIEDVRNVFTLGAEVYIAKSPFGVFSEYQKFDNRNMLNTDLLLVGIVLRY